MIKVNEHIKLKHGSLDCFVQFEMGKIYAIIGKNGIGKSSFFQYLKVHQKKIFNQRLVRFLDQKQLAPLGELTGNDLFHLLGEYFDGLKEVKIKNLISHFDFEPKLDRAINNLSGGENQILKILATFYNNCDVAILDEPSNHLDLSKQKKLSEFLKNFINENKVIILVDHKKDFLLEVCDNFIHMDRNDQGQLTLCEVSKEQASIVLGKIIENDYGI